MSNLVKVFLFVSLLVLASCGATAPKALGPDVSIASNIAPLAEGSTVSYKINYKNTHTTENFDDVILTISYDKDVTFVKANPSPNDINTNMSKVTWELGSLSTSKDGLIEVQFKVANKIDAGKYELEASIDIKGKDKQGKLVDNGLKLLIPIAGRSTPTPTNTNTSIPTKTPTFTPTPTSTKTPIPTKTPTFTPTPTPDLENSWVNVHVTSIKLLELASTNDPLDQEAEFRFMMVAPPNKEGYEAVYAYPRGETIPVGLGDSFNTSGSGIFVVPKL